MIKEISRLLSEDERAKLPKFYSNIVIAEENVENTKEIIKTFAETGLTFSKATDLRALTIEQNVLITTIEKYSKKDKFGIIYNNPSLLRFKAEIIISRIEDCEKVGKGYLNEDGTIKSFILNDDEWERVAEGLHLDEIVEEETPSYMTLDQAFNEEKAQNIIEALQSKDANLDIEDFEKYTTLIRVYNNAFASAGIEQDDKSKDRAEGIIMNLVSYEKEHKGAISDVDIVYATLICNEKWSREDAESMKPIIVELINSENMDLESSGVKL